MEVTPLTKWAFRSKRGRTGGLAFLLTGVLATVGLTACGAPAYTYVADSSAQAYYKVPSEWHQISQQSLDAALKAAGSSGDGIWSTAFDGSTAPSGNNFLAGDLDQPFVFAESRGLDHFHALDHFGPAVSPLRKRASTPAFTSISLPKSQMTSESRFR